MKRRKTMIRLILVVLTAVLYLGITTPFLWLSEKLGKAGTRESQLKILKDVKGIFRVICKLSGVTYEVQGLEHIPENEAVLYVGNHRSYFDILVGYMTVPGLTGFVAKKEMEVIPLLRTWMRQINCLFLDRDNIKEGLKTILEGIEKIKSGISIWIFPEGTRNENEDMLELLEFHEGSLKMAQKSGCAIIPVAITGTAEVLEQHFPWIRPNHIIIRYGEPIYIKDLPAQQKKFPGAYTREVIISMLKEMQ